MKTSIGTPKVAVFLAICVPPGNAQNLGQPASTMSISPQEIIHRTEQQFRNVVFYKPAAPGTKRPEAVYAPLIVEDVAIGSAEDLSLIVTIPGSTSNLKGGATTIYFRVIEATVSKSGLEEVIYGWRHEVVTETEFSASQIRFSERGVRIVVGPDGMPVLWEALGGQESVRVFFVASSLEGAAAQQFGKPLPGRRFSVERSVEETPTIVVARMLDDGPVPMGPYVYVEASSQDITTILCRCMASQFDHVLKTQEYELEPIDRLDPERPATNGSVKLERVSSLGPLVEFFRWPTVEDRKSSR